MAAPSFFNDVTTIAPTSSHTTQAIELENGGFAIIYKVQTSATTYDLTIKFFDAAGAEYSSSVIQAGITEDDSSYSLSRIGAALQDGSIVVIWSSPYTLFDQSTLYASRFGADGVQIGSDTIVSQNDIDQPDVNFYQDYYITPLDGGGYAVGWDLFNDVTGETSVIIQVFEADGTPVGAEHQVGVGPFDSPPLIAELTNGNLIVGYSTGNDGAFTVEDRTADGSAPVNGHSTTLSPINDVLIISDLRALSNGGFVVLWVDIETSTTPDTRVVKFQTYTIDEEGDWIPGEFITVDSSAARQGYFPAIIELSDGDLFVTWEATNGVPVGDPNSFNVIWGQRFNGDGSADGAAFVIGGTGAVGSADAQTLSLLADGRIVVSWGQAGAVSYRILDPRESGVNMTGDGADQSWYGTSFADTLDGGAGDDQLFGGAGADDIDGGADNDDLDGGAGMDNVNGGLGADRLTVLASEWTGSEVYDGGDGTDTLRVVFDSGANINLDAGTVSNIEAITFDADGQAWPSLRINVGSQISGLPSTLALTGSGSAVDVFHMAAAGATILNTSGWVLNNWSGGDYISFVGSVGADTYTGGASIDVVRSAGGTDTISTGGGADIIMTQGNTSSTINAGLGTDTLVIERSSSGATMAGGVPAWATSLTSSVLGGIEIIHFGDPTGSLSAQDANKAAFINSTQLGGGQLATNLQLIGHSGFTDVLVVFLPSAGSLNLSGVTFSNWDALIGAPSAGEDWLEIVGSSGVDTITGTSQGDVIYGQASSDSLFGQGGDDTLDGGAGADSMFGGEGNDTYYVDTGSDQTFEASAAWGTDLVYASVTYYLGTNIDNLTLTGASAINGNGNVLANVITGNGAVNQLYGNAGNDTLDGGAGADAMFGADGDDTYYVDNALDQVYEAQAGWGTDLVYSSVDYQIIGNIDNLTLTGAALVGRGNLNNNTLVGTSAANSLFGMAGNDVLNGMGGADQMYGREGDDIYHVDNAGDVAFEADAGWGVDTVYSSVTITLTPALDNLVLTGVSAINGNGNALANTITGNSAANTLFGYGDNDVLDGGGGADSMFGGEGDDTYYIDHAGDVAFEANSAWGSDWAIASVSYTLGQNIDNLSLAGAGDINGTGNGLNNVLVGNNGANTLNGGVGADSITGAGGNDILTGGAGDDAFVFFPVGQGDDTITDFVAGGAEDTIDLSALDGSGVTWEVTQAGADTLFSFSNGDSITLTNVDMNDLVALDPYTYG